MSEYTYTNSKQKAEARHALNKLLRAVKAIEPGTQKYVFLPTFVDNFDLKKICERHNLDFTLDFVMDTEWCYDSVRKVDMYKLSVKRLLA